MSKKNEDLIALNVQDGFFKNVLLVLSPYWLSEQRFFATVSVVFLIILSLLAVVSALVINEWYKYFYDSIQANDISEFYFLIGVFFLVVSISVLRSVAIGFLVDITALRWRRWLTVLYTDAWKKSTKNHKLLYSTIDNPDQRIAEDIRKFTFDTLDLGCGLIYTIASVISFSKVLIEVSGDYDGFNISIPYYMFWAALFYAVSGAYISQKIGFKLSFLSREQQKNEADFRSYLMRHRMMTADSLFSKSTIVNSEGAAIDSLEPSLVNMRKIINLKARFSLFAESYSQLSLVFSSLLAAPKFFTKEISFGELMQINSAFGNLCENLNWFISSYHRLADWKATSDRLITLHLALQNNPDICEEVDSPLGRPEKEGQNELG